MASQPSSMLYSLIITYSDWNMMNVQMNVRLDEQVKRAGDEVFYGMNLTPSQVVRHVWEYAAAHRDAPDAVRASLGLPASEMDALRREIEYESSICSRFREQFGIAPPDSLETIDYGELRERAMRERLKERGLA